MKSQKIEDEVINQGGDLTKITNSLLNNTPMNNMQILNKSLLPSRGLLYKQDLYVKKLSTIDIKNLSTITSDTVDGVMNSILARNVKGINVNDILVGDKIWLIFYLRSITYNDYPFEMRYTCDKCNNTDIYQMKLADLTVEYLKEDFNYDYKMNNGDEITITFPTIGNEIECNQITKEPEKWSITGIIDEEILNISSYVKSVNGKNLSIMKAYEYIENLDALSFTNFANYMQDENFGVKPYISIPCECGNKIILPLNFSQEYFMPKIK